MTFMEMFNKCPALGHLLNSVNHRPHMSNMLIKNNNSCERTETHTKLLNPIQCVKSCPVSLERQAFLPFQWFSVYWQLRSLLVTVEGTEIYTGDF